MKCLGPSLNRIPGVHCFVRVRATRHVNHNRWYGCLRNGALCGLFQDQDEAKGYADRLHKQLSRNAWLLKELS